MRTHRAFVCVPHTVHIVQNTRLCLYELHVSYAIITLSQPGFVLCVQISLLCYACVCVPFVCLLNAFRYRYLSPGWSVGRSITHSVRSLTYLLARSCFLHGIHDRHSKLGTKLSDLCCVLIATTNNSSNSSRSSSIGIRLIFTFNVIHV